MVTVQQARSLITQRRQQISQQRQELDTARKRIQETRLAKLTRAELQVRGREEMLARKKQTTQLEGLKKMQVKQLDPFEKELTSIRGDVDAFDKQVIAVEQQQRKQKERFEAFKSALDKFRSDDPRAIFGLSGLEEEFFRKISQGKTTAIRLQLKEESEKIKLDISEQGIKDIPDITKFEQLKIIAREALLGKTGEKFVGVRIIPDVLKGKFGTFLSKPDVPARDIKTFLQKGGLPSKVIAEFIPTKPAEALAFISIGGVATAGVPFVSKGVRIGISALGALTALDTEQKPETRIAGTIVAVAPFIPVLKLPTVRRDGKITAFPAGKRGQARFAELEEFFKKQNKKKLELDKVLGDLQFKQVGKTFKEKTKGEKVADLRKIINKIKKTKDPKLQQEQLRGTLRLLELTFGKAEAKGIFKEFLLQEGLTLTPQQAPSVKIFSKVVAKPTKPTVAVPAAALDVQLGENLFFLSEQQIKQRAKQPVAFFQPTAQPQVQPEVEVLTEAQKTKQKQQAKKRAMLLTALRVQQAQRISPKVKVAPKLKKPVPLLKIPKLPKGVNPTKLVKAIQKVGKEGLDIIIGQKLKKQRKIGKNLPKWKALKKAQKFVDRNIEASYLLKKSGKEAKGKDIKPFNISPKFRPSKKNVFFVVEKRKFRLDMPTEVRQIKLFKGKVPKGFLPKVKKKKKK